MSADINGDGKIDFEEFMKICRKSKDSHGNRFTYTLIETTDIK